MSLRETFIVAREGVGLRILCLYVKVKEDVSTDTSSFYGTSAGVAAHWSGIWAFLFVRREILQELCAFECIYSFQVVYVQHTFKLAYAFHAFTCHPLFGGG